MQSESVANTQICMKELHCCKKSINAINDYNGDASNDCPQIHNQVKKVILHKHIRP